VATIEVKANNMVDDGAVQAKAELTQQMAKVREISYQIIKGSNAQGSWYHLLLISNTVSGAF